MNLHQIKLEFIAEQDRMLLRISTSDAKEVLMWLTRRCVKLLWPLLMKMAQSSPRVQLQGSSAEARAALLGMEHEKAVRRADFSRPYEAAPRERPLGEQPILVARIETRKDERGNHVLTLLPARGQGVHVTLDEAVLHSFCRLLQNAVGRADWDLKLDFPDVAPRPEQPEGARTIN